MPYTIQQKINIAKVSQYLCGNDVEKRGLFGGGQDLNLERKIYIVRKSIEYIYGLDPTDDTLEGKSNYLYALCSPYNLQGAIIAQAGSGGSVSPINPSAPLAPLDFIVSSSSFIATDESSKVITDFKGYNITFVRGGIGQYTTDNGGSYFTWNKISGLFTCVPSASEDEPFQINPY